MDQKKLEGKTGYYTLSLVGNEDSFYPPIIIKGGKGKIVISKDPELLKKMLEKLPQLHCKTEGLNVILDANAVHILSEEDLEDGSCFDWAVHESLRGKFKK